MARRLTSTPIPGTNDWRTALGSYANNLLNASPFFFNQAYRLTPTALACFPNRLVNPLASSLEFGNLRRWSDPRRTSVFLFGAYQLSVNEDNATGLSEMTVPSGLTDDRSAAGLEAADLSWGGTGTVTIDPVAAALMNAKLPNGQFLIPSTQSNAN